MTHGQWRSFLKQTRFFYGTKQETFPLYITTMDERVESAAAFLRADRSGKMSSSLAMQFAGFSETEMCNRNLQRRVLRKMKSSPEGFSVTIPSTEYVKGNKQGISSPISPISLASTASTVSLVLRRMTARGVRICRSSDDFNAIIYFWHVNNGFYHLVCVSIHERSSFITSFLPWELAATSMRLMVYCCVDFARHNESWYLCDSVWHVSSKILLL